MPPADTVSQFLMRRGGNTTDTVDVWLCSFLGLYITIKWVVQQSTSGKMKENIFRKIKYFSNFFSYFYNQMKLNLLKLCKGALAKTAAGFNHIQLSALWHSKS